MTAQGTRAEVMSHINSMLEEEDQGITFYSLLEPSTYSLYNTKCAAAGAAWDSAVPDIVSASQPEAGVTSAGVPPAAVQGTAARDEPASTEAWMRSRIDCATTWHGSLHHKDGMATPAAISCNLFWSTVDVVFKTHPGGRVLLQWSPSSSLQFAAQNALRV